VRGRGFAVPIRLKLNHINDDASLQMFCAENGGLKPRKDAFYLRQSK
jgi:hypothetical protein